MEDIMKTKELQVGDRAPDFTLNNQSEEDVSLSEYAGSWLVLYFYPKDNTSGCTLEAKEFTCLVDDFSDLNAMVIGVSKDSIKSHNNFIEKHDLGIELLSDPEHEVMEKYGVWQMKKLYGREFMGIVRSTFLISPEGEIAHVWYKVKAKGHAEKVFETLKELQTE